MRKLLSLLTIVLFAVLAFGQGFDSQRAGLAQPSKRPPQIAETDWADVQKFLLSGLVLDFKKEAAKTGHDYDVQRQPKAAAACIDWPHGSDSSMPALLYWGDEWTDSDKDTPQSISQSALRECEAAKEEGQKAEWAKLGLHVPCNCQMLLQNSQPVMSVPVEAAKIIATKLDHKKVGKLCHDWFGGKDYIVEPFGEGYGEKRGWRICSGYTEEAARGMKFTIDDLALFEGNQGANIYPSAPVVRSSDIEAHHITDPSWGSLIWGYVQFYPPTGYSSFGPRDVESSFKLPDGWGYRVTMHQVPKSATQGVLDKIKPFEHSRLLTVGGGGVPSKDASPGHTEDLASSGDSPPDKLAMYIRTYDLTDEEVAKEVDFETFPEHRMSVIHGERSLKLWAECFIPIDDHGAPVSQPLRRLIPLALQTTSSFYLFSIQVDYVGQQGRTMGGTIAGFDGKVFDLSGCAKPAQCFEEVRRVFLSELTQDFSVPPLSAVPIHKNMPPYQARFQRLFDESNVLKGLAGPYYELTTYTITLWPGPSGDSTGPNDLYMNGGTGNGRPADQVFLQISQDLQIAVGRKGDYNEPTPQQYAAYQQAVDAVVKSAVSKATSMLGGTTSDGVGKVKLASSQQR